MQINIFLKGLLIGLSIAAPVGPIGLLCIRRTLAEGRLIGLFSGLGAATADATYGAIAAFGLTFISDQLINQQMLLRLIGGLFLVYLGAKTFAAKPAEHEATTAKRGLAGAYVTTLFLTITNPTTILSFVAIFAGIGFAEAHQNYAAASVLVAGVFLGSALWWLLLSSVVGTLHHRLDTPKLAWINKASGAVIIVFGLAALLSLF